MIIDNIGILKDFGNVGKYLGRRKQTNSPDIYT